MGNFAFLDFGFKGCRPFSGISIRFGFRVKLVCSVRCYFDFYQIHRREENLMGAQLVIMKSMPTKDLFGVNLLQMYSAAHSIPGSSPPNARKYVNNGSTPAKD